MSCLRPAWQSSLFALHTSDCGCVGRTAYPFLGLKGWRVIYLGLKRTPNCGVTLGQKPTPAVDPLLPITTGSFPAVHFNSSQKPFVAFGNVPWRSLGLVTCLPDSRPLGATVWSGSNAMLIDSSRCLGGPPLLLIDEFHYAPAIFSLFVRAPDSLAKHIVFLTRGKCLGQRCWYEDVTPSGENKGEVFVWLPLQGAGKRLIQAR